MAGDRGVAGAVERRQQRALGPHAGAGSPDRRAPPAAPAAAHRRRGTRARSRPGRPPAASPRAAGPSRRSGASPRRFRPACASSVASTSPAASLRSRVPTLPRRLTTRRSGRRASSWAWRRSEALPTSAPRRQRVEPARPPRDQHVARVLARQHRGQHQAVRQPGRQVLDRVHREVDPPRRAARPRAPCRTAPCRRARRAAGR